MDMVGPIIAIVGGLNMDMLFVVERIPDIGESINTPSVFMFPGGKGANYAIATYRASRAGPEENEEGKIRVFMNGAVGDDEFGITLKAKLEQEGIDVGGVQTIEGATSGTCVVFVEKESGDSRNIAYQGANLQWKPPSIISPGWLANGAKPDLVIAHLGVQREQVERVLEAAHRDGIKTLLNPSPALYLANSTYKSVTHLVLNETEAAILSARSVDDLNDVADWQETVGDFIQLGVTNVVITLGARGAYYATSEGEEGMVDAEKNIDVVDTTGAGDTFVGNYAAEYVKQKQSGTWDIGKAVARACKASARTIERLGAQESIPWAGEIHTEVPF